MISLFDFPEKTIFLAIEDDFRKLVFKSAEDIAGGRRELARSLGVSYSAVSEWTNGYKMRARGVKEPHHCPLYVYKRLFSMLPPYSKLPGELERNVRHYKGNGPSLCIKNPILPIRDTSKALNLVAHIFSDGCVPSSRKGQPFYCNSSEELINEFASGLHAFGDVECHYQTNAATGVRRLFFPLVLAKMLEHVYAVNFSSHLFLRPSDFLALSKKEKGAFLRGFFDDEGYVHDSNLQICSLHGDVLDLLAALLNSLNVSTSKKRRYRDYIRIDNSTSSVKYFDIPSGSIPTFAKMVGFTHPKKQEHLAHIIARQQRNWKHSDVDKTRKIILQELATGPVTARTLSHRTLITMRNVRGTYLKALEEEGAILKFAKQKGKGGATLWALRNIPSNCCTKKSETSQSNGLASQPKSSS